MMFFVAAIGVFVLVYYVIVRLLNLCEDDEEDDEYVDGDNQYDY